MNPVRRLACLKRLLGALLLFVAVGAQAGTPDAERAQVRTQSAEVLARLYAARPEAKAGIEHAAGYATFRNFGLKLGVAGTGRGKGLAIFNKGHEETFMQFLELQAGLGVGIKRYDLVFVFETEKAYRDFIAKGWEYSGQSTLAAKHKTKGSALDGAAAVSPGVWLYQLTSSGLAAEVTLKSSRYYKDKDLN